jgi:hypothetical protein
MARETFVKTLTEQEAQAAVCAHHWVLETPAGAVSRGRCRICGALKEFRNSTTDFVWEEERRSAVSFWTSDSRSA